MEIKVIAVDVPHNAINYLIYGDRHFLGWYSRGEMKWNDDSHVKVTLKDLQNIVNALENL